MIIFQYQFIVDICSKLYPKVIFFSKNNKIVALTIDDSPNNDTTLNILKTLLKYNSTATFFVIGSYVTEKNKHILSKLVESGNELGNHLMYDSPSIELSSEKFIDQLVKVNKILNQYNKNNKTKFFRPGSGIFNSQMLATINLFEMRTVLSNVYPFDPQFPYEIFVKTFVIKRVRNGCIIILHDRLLTERILDEILYRIVKVKGFKVVTLSKLMEKKKG